jgi:hypothetical protein
MTTRVPEDTIIELGGLVNVGSVDNEDVGAGLADHAMRGALLVGGVPTRTGTKHGASFIFVFNHEAAVEHMYNVALVAPMVRLVACAVSNKANPDVSKILSAANGGARLAVLHKRRNGRPIDGGDGYILNLHSCAAGSFLRF